MKKLISASLLVLTLSACSIPLTPTGIPTFTAIPARTSTATSMPTSTALPPSETPNVGSAWNGIPIMPGATAGEGDEEGYVFTISVTPQSVQEYYQLELGKFGWQLLSHEDSDSSMILIFTNSASETLTIHVIAKDGEALVLLVK